MSFRGRYATKFRRTGGFRKPFANEREFTFKRKFPEERGGPSFKRPRGASSFYRRESSFEHQAQTDRGRGGQWNSKHPRGRSLRTPRSRYMRGRGSYNESRGRQPRHQFERTEITEWFEEGGEFDTDRDRPFPNPRSSRLDYEEELEEGFDESLIRSVSPFLIRRTFSHEGSPERYSRERSFERKRESPLTTEHFEEERFDNERRSRSFRSRSLEKYDYEMRNRIPPRGRSSPFSRDNSMNFRGGSREGSFDRRHSPGRNYKHSLDRQSHHRSVKRNNLSRSPERLYDRRRNSSPQSTTSNQFHRHNVLGNDTNYQRRNNSPYLNISSRRGSEASYHSSLHGFQSRNITSPGDDSVQNYGSPIRRNYSPDIRRRSEERMIDSPSRLDGHMRDDFERQDSSFETNYHQRPTYRENSPIRQFSSEQNETYSRKSFSHENKDDQDFRRNNTSYFVERQRMKRVFNDERRRGHEKRSESSIERFLNDCKKSVERRPGSSRVSSPRDTSREYEFELKQYGPHSSRRKFHGPDQIVIERGKSFEKSLSSKINNVYQNSKNALGSPTEWGNGKKEVVSQTKESSANNTVPDLKQTDDNEIRKDTNELEKTEDSVVSQTLCDPKKCPVEDNVENTLETNGCSSLNNKVLETIDCKESNFSPISQHENFELKELSPSKKTKGSNSDLSPISQSSLVFKNSPNKPAHLNDENIGLSPISQHENFDQTEGVDHLDLSPISQPGSFERREFLQDTDNLSGLSLISQNSLRDKEISNEKKLSKSPASCDSMQEFLKELERSCERSRSGSESSFECRMKISLSKKELNFPVETAKSNPERQSRDHNHSQYSWKRELEHQSSKSNQVEFQNTPKYASKITYTYQGSKRPHQEWKHNNEDNTLSNKFDSSTVSHWTIHDPIDKRGNIPKNNMSQTSGTSSQENLKNNPYNYSYNQSCSSLDISNDNQNQHSTYNLNPYNQIQVLHETLISKNNTQDLQRQPKENPSQNQHVLQVLGPKSESKVHKLTISAPTNYSYSNTNLQNKNSKYCGLQSSGQSLNQFTHSNTINMTNQMCSFSMPFNQNAPYAQSTPVTVDENMYEQNNFVTTPNENPQVEHWNSVTLNAPFASGSAMSNYNAVLNLNQPYSSTGIGLPPNLAYGAESNFNNFSMFHNQNRQYSSGSQSTNQTPAMHSTQFLISHSTINQTFPSSQNSTGSFLKHVTNAHLGTSNPSCTNVASMKSKPFKATTIVDIKKCLSGTFGQNYVSLLNNAVTEVISLSDDEGPEGSDCYGTQPQNFISLNPTLLDQYKNNPPSAEEMAKMLGGFVIFFDVKTNSDLEKDPFVVIHESFAKSNKFGNLQAEETDLYVDFLPVPKKVCVLRWQGLMLARAEAYTLEEARRKASIALINALAQNFYTVQTKYSYYCGGKLPKFMMKTREQPGVYKVVERDEIIKAVTDVLKELKQKGVYTGKGVDATSIKVVLDFIDNFFKDQSNYCELLFGGKLSFDYTLEDLKQISNHVKRVASLQCRSIAGYGRGMFTAVSRVKTPQQLCRYLLFHGGETARYKLLPPQGPWIELLTADAQYHPAIVKSIPKKLETSQELNIRNNQIPGGYGSGWGKRGT